MKITFKLYKENEHANVVSIILGSVIVAVAFNLFFIPHNILSGGLSGIAMLLGIISLLILDA